MARLATLLLAVVMLEEMSACNNVLVRMLAVLTTASLLSVTVGVTDLLQNALIAEGTLSASVRQTVRAEFEQSLGVVVYS
jgi:hypothetical protein